MRNILQKLIFAFYFLLFLINIPMCAYAQSWQWGQANGGAGIDAWAVAADPFGNIYASGFAYEGDVTFGTYTLPYPPSLLTEEENGIIVKYNNAGSVLWAKGFNTTDGAQSEPVSMATDPAGNLIVLTIISTGTVSLDAFSSTTSQTFQYLLTKISPTGTVLWSVLSAEASTFYGQFIATAGGGLILSWGAVACDNAGNIYITGNYNVNTSIGTTTLNNSSTFSGDNIFVARYDPSGNPVWATSMGGTASDDAFGITVSSTGNVYISGAMTSPSMTVGSSTLSDGYGVQIAYIAEFNGATGAGIWGETAGGAGGAYGAGLTSDASGNVYLTGAFGDPTITFGSTTFSSTYPSSGFLELYLLQLNSSNTVTWHKTIGSPTYNIIGYCIGLASCGQVWVSGSWPDAFGITDSINIDGIIMHTPDSSGDPVFIAGYNLSGGVVGYGGLQSGADDQLGLACDPSGNVYICADFYNESFTNFVVGPDILGYDPTWAGSEFFYLAKFTNVIGAPDTIRKATDTSLCSAGSYQLSAPAGYYGPFLWSNGDTTQTITLNTSGTFWLECPGGCNTTYLFDTFQVNVNNLDTVHNSKDTGICSGNSATLNAPAGYPAYIWNTTGSGTASSITVNAAGTYWVQCYDSCSMAPTIDTFHVSINVRDSAYSHSDTTICSQLGITLNGPAGFLTYQWSNGNTSSTVSVGPGTGTDVLWVACSDSCNLPYTVDTFHITFQDVNLNFSLGNDTFACGPVLLQVPLTGVSYLWQNGSTNQDLTATKTGAYYCKVSELGCNFSDTINVNISYEYPYSFDTNVCLENSFAIALNAYVPQGSSVLWNTGAKTSTISVVDTGTYFAYVKDSVCTTVDTMHVTGQYCNCWCWVPNAFTPHGKINTGFKPIIDPYCTPLEYTFTIFDRWGKTVFTTNDPTQSWDGTYGGVPADLDVYMFQVSFFGGMQNKKFFFKGDVTLVR